MNAFSTDARGFPLSLGRIVRLIYSAADWTSGPGRVRADNVFVTMASFPHDDTKRVLLLTDRGRRVIQLLVVPPEWEERGARHAMRIAASPTNSKSAATILAESDDLLRHGLLAHWDDDGGHSASR
jgi:hypothetical protein